MIVNIEDELKSPLNSILSFSATLNDDNNLSEKQEKYLNIIRSNALELYSFIDKFCEFTYAESSLYIPEYQRFDVISLLKEFTEEYKTKFDEKKLTLNFDTDSIDKRSIYTDLKGFKKYITNILEVALSTSSSGVFTVRLNIPDEETSLAFGLKDEVPYLQITIENCGEGIDQENRKSLCDPYFWLGKNKKSFVRALKLGSASILIKRAGGFFDISSESMRGDRFIIIIPIEKDKNE